MAQSPWISTSASLGLSSDFYQQNGLTESRLPSQVHRATLRATITLFEQIELPFEAFITSNDAGYRQPFNQFGVNPRFGNWLQLHAGYFSTRISDLTFGDARILGGGFDLTPGKLRLSAIYGYTREARNPDATNGFFGDYRRKVIGGKIGIGDETGTTVTLNVMYATDDSTSIRRDTLTPTPNENLVGSIAAGFNLLDNVIRFTAEGAVSAYTSNTQAPLIDSASRSKFQESVFNANISSAFDAAVKGGLTLTPSQYWNIRFDAQWIGPGFMSLGFVQMMNDVLDMTVSPSLRLFNNKFFLRGSIGRRTNNVRNTRLAATDRTIGSLTSSMQFTENIGLDVMYSNFGMRSTHRSDTIRVENISQMYSFTPRATFELLGGSNSASLTASFQNSDDKNQFSQSAVNNTTQSFVAVHTISFPSSLSLSTTAFSNSVQNSVVNTSILTFNETVGYSFFERLLGLSATLGVNFIRSQGNDAQFMARLSANFNMNEYGSFTLQLMNNNYDFSAISRQPSYSEYQGSIQYSIAY
ncbi:MAG: hypothetical protein JNL32_01675 [Candidatus Kapabacteria bacterium]|nr:hypothetical protein [Candidatus Kapabacteria bacterium]